MTHDELLDRVNRIKAVSCDENIDFEHVHSLNEPKACNECLTCMGLSALRAVVKLITKEDTIPLDDYHFGYMAACKDIYEAIEKELR